MKVWVYQDHRQRKKLGAKAPWSVGFFDQAGKKRSKRIGSRSVAKKYGKQIEAQLLTGTYRSVNQKKWPEFRSEYTQKIVPRLGVRTRDIVSAALDHFERICSPCRVDAIKTQTIDDFVARRCSEPGKKGRSTVSPFTLNKELRHIKSALGVAHEWGYLTTLPRVRFVKEPKKLKLFVTEEDFLAIFTACEHGSLAGWPRLLTSRLVARVGGICSDDRMEDQRTAGPAARGRRRGCPHGAHPAQG